MSNLVATSSALNIFIGAFYVSCFLDFLIPERISCSEREHSSEFIFSYIIVVAVILLVGNFVFSSPEYVIRFK